jgi:uncharacterized protein YodC (DUF2158 family)
MKGGDGFYQRGGWVSQPHDPGGRMLQEFTVGLTVRQKTGGPAMTIVSLDIRSANPHAECKWMDGEDQKTGYFALDDLEIVGPPSRHAYVAAHDDAHRPNGLFSCRKA